MPFKFGAVAVTSFPLLHVAATVVTAAGTCVGYAADNLMPKWFDKAGEKTVGDNSRDLATSAESASRIYRAAGRQASLFDLWETAYPQCRSAGAALGLNPLVTSFGSALMERAIADAVGRATGLNLRATLRADALGLRPERVH